MSGEISDSDSIADRLQEITDTVRGTLYYLEENIENLNDDKYRQLMPKLEDDQVIKLPNDDTIDKVKFIPVFAPGAVKIKQFKKISDKELYCWSLGKVYSSDLPPLEGQSDAMFRTNRLKVNFPIENNKYFFFKSFKLTNPATLKVILRAIEITAIYAKVYERMRSDDLTPINMHTVYTDLITTDICYFLLRRAGGGNQVYVRPGPGQ